MPHKKYRISKRYAKTDKLIKIISKSSSRYGDKLLDFMNQYKLDALKDTSAKQLEEYIKKNDLR